MNAAIGSEDGRIVWLVCVIVGMKDSARVPPEYRVVRRWFTRDAPLYAAR